MADPVGLGVKTPDAFQTLGSLLNFANTAQNIQRGNIDLQQNQIRLDERKAIQNLFSNPQSFKSPDGLFDYNKLITEGMKVAPTTFPAMVPQIISAHKSGVEAQQAFMNLDNDKRKAVGGFVGSMIGDDGDTINRKFTALENARPDLKPWTAQARKNLEKAIANKDQKAIDAALGKISQWAMTATEQVSANTPQIHTVNTGQSQYGVNIKPSAGPIGSIVPGTFAKQQVAPGAQETVVTDALGNKFVMRMDADGKIVDTRPVPNSAPPASPGSAPSEPKFTNLSPGDADAIPLVTKDRAAINTAAMRVPESRMNNREMLKLVDPAFTGKGAEILARIGGQYAGIGAGWESNAAESYNKLGHLIARESANLAQSMGLSGTDAARGLAEQANVSTGWTKDAIKSAIKMNDALATSIGKFNEGMEAAIRNAGGNVLAARDFKNAWSRSFDPDVYRYANALETGDKAEIDKILGKPGSPERAARARALAAKSSMLNQLVTNGR